MATNTIATIATATIPAPCTMRRKMYLQFDEADRHRIASISKTVSDVMIATGGKSATEQVIRLYCATQFTQYIVTETLCNGTYFASWYLDTQNFDMQLLDMVSTLANTIIEIVQRNAITDGKLTRIFTDTRFVHEVRSAMFNDVVSALHSCDANADGDADTDGVRAAYQQLSNARISKVFGKFGATL